MSKTHRSNLGSRVFKLEIDVFLRLCEAVNTPRALSGFMLASAGEWSQYLQLSSPDTESDSFADDLLITECMRKNPHLDTGIDKELVATRKWWESEHACANTNELLSAYSDGRISFHPDIELLLTKTQKIIADVLGPLNRAKLKFAESRFRFGPGSTSSCSGSEVILSRKMTSIQDVTPGLYPYWRAITLNHPGFSDSNTTISLVAYNKVTFVPKDSKTDRAIAIEPHLNIFVQLGIGALLRRQMSSAGLNLDTQADINRYLAGRAMRFDLCTIDLASASDTISYELVKLLLPVDWYSLLDTARCEYSLIDGQEHKLAKFSSMGNGFTFELESLIFWALARACGDDNAVSFGDDIICHRSISHTLIRILNLLGFSVNEKKTFLAGRFFESCGEDYWNGVNVRPFYLKGTYEDFQLAVIRICNKIRLYARRRNLGFGCDVRFLRPWLYCFHRDPVASKTYIPLGYGNDGLIRNFDEATPSIAKRGFEGFIGRVWRRKPLKSKKTSVLGAYVASLAFGASSEPDCYPSNKTGAVEYVRGASVQPSLASQLVKNWEGPGAWCRF